MSEQAVREAFLSQAEFCTRLGSPFTGALCRALASALDRETRIGRRLLDWAGNPSPGEDNVPLRLCGGLHALVRSGRAQELASLYPPETLPDGPALEAAAAAAIAAHADWLDPWLQYPPQTNEVGRSAPLMAGLLAIADRFALPLRLYELGASAGLNLQLEHFHHELGGLCFGPSDSAVRLCPQWYGASPPDSKMEIVERRGVDISPIADTERLLTYAWPDQPDRMARIAAAAEVARNSPVAVDQGDAADWIESRLSAAPAPGAVRVVFHSIAFQYFPGAAQARIRACISAAGEAATEEAPVAWLRLEMLAGESTASLRLRTWPGGERLLAWVHPHGRNVSWL